MNCRLIVAAAALLIGGCASSSPFGGPGFSAAAYIAGGSVDLTERQSTIEECAAAVRAGAASDNPASLGRVSKGDTGEVGDAVGLCGGPDGRMYFITPTEIQSGPTIMFER
jgi:hypothetical protein